MTEARRQGGRSGRAAVLAVAALAAAAVAPARPAAALPGDPPYLEQLLRLSEILGALHHLRPLCGAAEGQLWRQKMGALLTAQDPSPDDRRRLIERFNQKNPTRRITPLNVLQSVRNSQKRIDQAEGGVYLPKNRRDAIQAGRFALAESE